jgi:hypothetical protein
MPKISGFLGATYLPGYAGDDEERNKLLFTKII